MRRRLALLAAVVLGVLTAPPVTAQPSGKAYRIGVLCSTDCTGPEVEAFRQGLRDHGWIDGQNVRLEYRNPERQPTRLPALAAELVRLNPDVIVTWSTPGVQAATQATKTIPIVVATAGGLVRRGIVKSLARPGGNVTGLTLIGDELEPKRLELLKEAVPKSVRVGVLVNPANPSWDAYPTGHQAEAARALGVRLQRGGARTPREIEGALSAMVKAGADALLVANDAMFSVSRDQIAALAVKARLPSVSELRGFAAAGGLLQFGPSTTDMSRRAAVYVDKILKGAKPADLPVEQPTRFHLVVNLKTAKALGLTIPQSILVRADEVIQ